MLKYLNSNLTKVLNLYMTTKENIDEQKRTKMNKRVKGRQMI